MENQGDPQPCILGVQNVLEERNDSEYSEASYSQHESSQQYRDSTGSHSPYPLLLSRLTAGFVVESLACSTLRVTGKLKDIDAAYVAWQCKVLPSDERSINARMSRHLTINLICVCQSVCMKLDRTYRINVVSCHCHLGKGYLLQRCVMMLLGGRLALLPTVWLAPRIT